jgi:hypothetical protein
MKPLIGRAHDPQSRASQRSPGMWKFCPTVKAVPPGVALTGEPVIAPRLPVEQLVLGHRVVVPEF